MTAALFYFAANVVALCASALIGIAFVISNPRSFNARVFAGVTLSSVCYLVGRVSYAVPKAVQIHFWIWPYLLTLMNTGPGFWMILAYSLFQEGKRIPRWMLAAFAVQFLLSAINAFAYSGRSSSVLMSPEFPPVVNFIFGPLPIAMQSAFTLLALYWAVRGWRADLVETRRWLRGAFLITFGTLSFGISVTELVLLDAAYAERAPYDNALTIVMAVGYVIAALAVFRFDERALARLVDNTSPLPDPASDPAFDRDLTALQTALNEQKVYLTPGLSIGDLARHLAMPEYRLRALINKQLGYRNFNALLHEYRLREACERLADPAMTHVPILTIALDVGYQSITPFNQAFRDAKGCTPSIWRQRQSKPA